MAHANNPHRPGGFQQRHGLKSGEGRRRLMRRVRYHFQSRFAPITGETVRHCYVHPSVEAKLWEFNTQDNSYKRPLCIECFESA